MAQLRFGVGALLQRFAPGGLTQDTSALPHASVEGLRVLAVIPGDDQGSSFIFARRQIASLADVGLNVRTFCLRSRTSPVAILREWLRLGREIRDFRPH